MQTSLEKIEPPSKPPYSFQTSILTRLRHLNGVAAHNVAADVFIPHNVVVTRLLCAFMFQLQPNQNEVEVEVPTLAKMRFTFTFTKPPSPTKNMRLGRNQKPSTNWERIVSDGFKVLLFGMYVGG